MRLRQHLLEQRGFTLIEVMVTIVILAFGLLGMAGLQARIHILDLESFQRGQAVILLNDMVERINTNRANAASYVSANAIGTGDTQPASCAGLPSGATKDLCEWSNLLKGAAEKASSNPVGGMNAARGCITAATLPVADAAMGMCQTYIQVDVVWQGTSPSGGPAITCGNFLYDSPPPGGGPVTTNYYRRSVSTRVGTGAVAC